MTRLISTWPAIVIDGAWQFISGNSAAMQMIQFLPLEGSLSLIDALMNDDPDNPVFLNWEVISSWTLQRLQIESARDGGQGPVAAIYQKLAADPRLSHHDLTSFSDHGPYLTLQFKAGDQVLSLFTMMAEFTTAQDINMSQRRVELFFPSDETTKAFFESL